jgi:hypothetical protein
MRKDALLRKNQFAVSREKQRITRFAVIDDEPPMATQQVVTRDPARRLRVDG